MRRSVRVVVAWLGSAAMAACQEPAPKADPLDAGEALARCDGLAPELAITCRVEAAARAGREGGAEVVERACGALEGRWAEECRFRSGEELARAGRLADGLAQCAKAGEFARFCITHASWGAPPGGLDGPAAGATDATAWEAATAVFDEALRSEARETVRARWWFSRYFGTGEADPTTVPDLPEARGGWALEAVRLTGDQGRAKEAWTAGATLRGEALPVERRLGRYDAMMLPAEKGLPRVRTFGGGSRLVGASAEEDLDIALLEAMFFREATRGEALLPWLDDPRPLVRYTAVKLFRILPSEGAEARLTAMAADPDPIVQAHVADALQHKTWLGKGKGAGPR